MLIDSAVVIESGTFAGDMTLIMHDGPDVNLIILNDDGTVYMVEYLTDEQDEIWSGIIDESPDYRVDYLA